MSSDIHTKVERSSLGTKSAKAARRTIPATTALKVVARAAHMSPTIRRKKSGG